MRPTDSFERQSPYKELERNRQERLLKVVSTSLARLAILATVIYLAVFFVSSAWQMLVAAINAVLIVVVDQIVRVLVRRGRLNLASYLLLISMLPLMGLTALIVQGLAPVIAPAYAALVVIAGMLLGTTGSFVVGSIAFGLWAASFFANARGLIPAAPLAEPLPTVVLVVITGMTFFFISLVAQAATRDLRRALDEATFELGTANRQLAEANLLKSQFMARTSHELRTPLNSLIGYTDLMLRNLYGPLTPRQFDALNRVLRNSKRLLALISDILDLSKIEAGQLELAEESVEVRSLVDGLRTTIEPAAQAKGLLFSVLVDESMPPRILGDEQRISQVMLNLADNAVKFTEKGKVVVLLEPVDKARWHLVVQDTGRGIHEGDFGHIFEEFRQLDTGAHASRGSGLGLTITRQLVHMMRGEIRLSSQIGQGSTFEVVLPLKVSTRTALPASQVGLSASA